MARRRFHRVVFALAGAYNLAWGVYAVLDPQWLFRFAGLPLQNYPQIFACLGLVIGLYGILYLEVARLPERCWLLAAVGLLGKVLGPVGLARLIWSGQWPWSTGDYRNNARITYDPTAYNFFNAAVAMHGASGPPDYAAGPIWAIFDADAVAREQWHVTPPYVDPDGYFFSANTLEELAAAITNPYHAAPMDGATLQATVARYNAFVDTGTDRDFGKPVPQYKIRTRPFYAAWATPLVHDTRAGLRINAQSQVMDMQGQVIPGLYCGGESAGGFNQHGLGRCTTQGYIAGKNAAAERPQA